MKHRFIAKRYWKNSATAMGAADELAKLFDDVIDLSLGDPDLITDERVIDGAFEDAKKGHTKYTAFRGDPELREAISKDYRKEYGLAVEDSEIMVTASGCAAMHLALEAILDEGDEVIFHTPCFTPYIQQIELTRGRPVPLATYEEENFEVNRDALQKLITPRTKALIVNTPTNPTGVCFSRETLEGIAKIAKEHDLLVIADDIYRLYSFDRPFTPIMSLEGMRERVITINSFSKDYTMTGWRIGYIIAPAYLIRTIQQINENVVFTAPSISQRAALHALRNREAIQPQYYEEYKKRLFYAAGRLKNMNNISALPPKGTFYLFANIKATGLSSAEVAGRILQEAHVNTIQGDAFGDAGEGYIRFACTCAMETLKEAFDRIEKMQLFQ